MKLYRECAQKKAKRLAQWHKWFAWYPVKVGDEGYRWLEVVQRKIAFGLARNGMDKGRKYLPPFKGVYANPDFDGFKTLKF